LTYATESRSAAEYRTLADEIINGRVSAEQFSVGQTVVEEISNVKI
jgi:hypothetical protein